MIYLSILLILLLILFVWFVIYSSSNKSNSNEFIKKIKVKNYLTNIFYKNEKQEYKYGFIKVINNVDKANDKLTFFNILKNNNKESININDNVGTLYNPMLFNDLRNIIQNNKTLKLRLKNIETLKLKLKNNPDEMVITFNEFLFTWNDYHSHLFIINDYVQHKSNINIDDIEYISLKIKDSLDDEVFKGFQILNVFKNFDFDQKYYSNYEAKLLLGFYPFFHQYQNYEIAKNASKFFFINVNKLEDKNKKIALQYIEIINLINIHIELFVLFKLFTQNSRKANKLFVYDYLKSLIPSVHITFTAFECSYTLLDLSNLFYLNTTNSNKDHYNYYILDLIINNINVKYKQSDMDKFLKVITSMIDNKDDLEYLKFKFNTVKI